MAFHDFLYERARTLGEKISGGATRILRAPLAAGEGLITGLTSPEPVQTFLRGDPSTLAPDVRKAASPEEVSELTARDPQLLGLITTVLGLLTKAPELTTTGLATQLGTATSRKALEERVLQRGKSTFEANLIAERAKAQAQEESLLEEGRTIGTEKRAQKLLSESRTKMSEIEKRANTMSLTEIATEAARQNIDERVSRPVFQSIFSKRHADFKAADDTYTQLLENTLMPMAMERRLDALVRRHNAGARADSAGFEGQLILDHEELQEFKTEFAKEKDRLKDKKVPTDLLEQFFRKYLDILRSNRRPSIKKRVR